MTKLSQIVAIQKGVSTKAGLTITKAYHLIQKPASLSGFSKRYTPAVDGDVKYPDEGNHVQYKVAELLAEISTAHTRLFNVVATKEAGNTEAKADVRIGGKVFLEQVPVGTLLFLENQLTNLHTVLSKTPTLDVTEQWDFDPADKLWKSRRPTESLKTKSVKKGIVLYPHSDKHPAQTTVVDDTEIQGTWTTVRYSGALSAAEREQILDRIDTLKEAVVKAREEANSREVVDSSIGKPIFDYLFG